MERMSMPDPVLSRFLDESKELLPSAVLLRRRIHENPELGLDLPLTTEAVLDGLQGLDIEIARGTSTSGLIVSLTGTKPGSQSGRTILLRGDMDALAMPEETGLEFASKIPGRMHACGHDSHTAMLGVAAMPRCRIWQSTRCRLPVKSEWRCTPWSLGAVTPSIRSS